MTDVVSMLPRLFFAYFAVAILGLGLLVITRKNIVHSVMWMVLLFVHIAGLYLFLNAEFIAAIQIIVYAGAIMVLFLFVVLLLNLRQEVKVRRFISSWQGRVFIPALLLLCIVSATRYLALPPAGEYSIQYIQEQTHTKVLGTVLFTEYLFPFIILALVLFVPMIAAVVLAMKRKGGR